MIYYVTLKHEDSKAVTCEPSSSLLLVALNDLATYQPTTALPVVGSGIGTKQTVTLNHFGPSTISRVYTHVEFACDDSRSITFKWD